MCRIGIISAVTSSFGSLLHPIEVAAKKTQDIIIFSLFRRIVVDPIYNLGVKVTQTIRTQLSIYIGQLAFPPLLSYDDIEKIKALNVEVDESLQQLKASGKSRVFKISDVDPDFPPIGITMQHIQRQKDHKHILVFLNGDELWQTSLKFLILLHRETGADVTSFNYLRINRQLNCKRVFYTGEESLFAQISKQVSFLIHERGVKPENITFFGRHLGGTIAAIVAKRMANIASFKLALVSAPKNFKAYINTFSRFPRIFHSFFSRYGWKLDAAHALDNPTAPVLCAFRENDPTLSPKRTIKPAVETSPSRIKPFLLRLQEDELSRPVIEAIKTLLVTEC